MLQRSANQGPGRQPKPTEPQFVPKQISKQVLTQWETTVNMIALLLKSHNRQNTLLTFNKLKKYNQIKKKYSSFLANKLHLLQKRKHRQYLKFTFSVLQTNRINFYTAKKDEYTKLKQNTRNKAVSLISIISSKLEKSKLKNYFNELKLRSSLHSKLKTFKNLHLFNLFTSLFQKKIKEAWNKIDVHGKHKLHSLRRISRIEKLFTTKTKSFLQHSIVRLRINLLQARAADLKEKENEIKETKPAPKSSPLSQQKSDKQLETQIKKLESQQKGLNDKKKNLEKELSKLQGDSQKTLNEFKKQIERLEIENSELVFNHDLLQQNNQQLEREYQIKQKSNRKKLSKAQIWENVYNNLIHFLTLNKDRPITKSELLQCLEVPLVPCNINIQQITEQNQILTQLLNEYKKNFPQPQTSVENVPDLLPFDIIRKQNRYYYMVLQVLSQWGLSGSAQLEQLNNDLAAIQRKLTS